MTLPEMHKTFSKAGSTGVAISAASALDILANVFPSVLKGQTMAISDWHALSWFTLVGGFLVAVFRKYSDGKRPKVF